MARQGQSSRVSTPGGVIRALGARGAAALGAASGSYNKTVQALRQQFPSLPTDQLYRAASDVYARGKYLSQQSASTTASRFPRGFIQPSSTLINPYRYVVQFSGVDPQTGATILAHHPYDSNAPLSPNQIVTMASADLPRFLARKSSDPWERITAGTSAIKITIIKGYERT